MKKYQMIRTLFDFIMANGESYNRADANSAYCTRDSFVNRVYIKKLHLGVVLPDGIKIDSASITCTKEDYSDATDADIRIEFAEEVPVRTILWANELSDIALNAIIDAIPLASRILKT